MYPKKMPHPTEVLPVRCKATNKQGNRCGKPPVPGATVCNLHGGSAPQVRRKAALRLAALVDPSIATMAQIMSNPNGRAGDRLRAANSILDRAGIIRQTDVDLGTAQALLVQRLMNAQGEIQ